MKDTPRPDRDMEMRDDRHEPGGQGHDDCASCDLLDRIEFTL